jgi:SAM-dependent methyltransferase
LKKKTKINQRTWNLVADHFIDASHLPSWGPFNVGKSLNLIGPVKGKTFLEVGCGSGRSIKYLTGRGAKKVYGLDFSKVQLEEAARYNKAAIKSGKVVLLHQTMEEKIPIEPVDIVFSVYAFGWSEEPKVTLKNIYACLKPGGKFLWSWDHTFFTDVVYENGKFVVNYAYHDEKPKHLEKWKGEGAYITYRKTSTWIKLLREAGFEIVEYLEPEPESLERGSDDPTKYYSIQKAKMVPCSFIFVCRKLLLTT